MFDYYASLGSTRQCTERGSLSSGFVDCCSVCFYSEDKNKARSFYMKYAQEVLCQIPEDLKFTQSLARIPDSNWLGFEISFTLKTPWYSKDDRTFHVLDNPVRKDRVFGVPYQSASTWKGLLRWACRMESGLVGYLEKTGMRFEGWKDPEWISYLFGNERSQQEDFRRGSLVFYPSFFDKIDFEVINPHDRKTRAGIQPIYYEVVPPKTEGKLQLLYAPHPGVVKPKNIDVHEALNCLLTATERLLTVYGISAKRTSGWGTTKIKSWKTLQTGKDPIEESSLNLFKDKFKVIFETRLGGELDGK